MSRVVLKWFELRWPREVDSERLVSVFRTLAGSKVAPVVIEAVGIDRGVVHRLALPEAASPMLLAQMRAALPAIGFVKLEDRPPVEIDRAVEMRLSTTSRPLDMKGSETVCRALLTALASVRNGESLVLQWQLARVIAPLPVGSSAREPESGRLPAMSRGCCSADLRRSTRKRAARFASSARFRAGEWSVGSAYMPTIFRGSASSSLK